MLPKKILFSSLLAGSITFCTAFLSFPQDIQLTSRPLITMGIGGLLTFLQILYAHFSPSPNIPPYPQRGKIKVEPLPLWEIKNKEKKGR